MTRGGAPSGPGAPGLPPGTLVSAEDPLLAELARAPEEPLHHGARIAHYRILGPLGRGGMGTVVRAHDELLDREVALKVLHEANGDVALRRLVREARTAARLEHPCIARVHSVSPDTKPAFFTMELVRGESLRTRLERPLELEAALAISRDVAAGLAHAHRQGVIHRDLKAENVLIGEDGGTKLTDFGIARTLDAAQCAPGTTTEALVGTPSSMAPEQARGEPADARSDVFAFGVLLYELCHGAPPFRRRTTAETLAAILHEPPPRGARAIPRELARLLDACLAKNPAARPRDGGALVARLEALRVPSPLHGRRTLWWAFLGAAAALLAAWLGLRAATRPAGDAGAAVAITGSAPASLPSTPAAATREQRGPVDTAASASFAPATAPATPGIPAQRAPPPARSVGGGAARDAEDEFLRFRR